MNHRSTRRAVLAGSAAVFIGGFGRNVVAETDELVRYVVVVDPDGDPDEIADTAATHFRTTPLDDVTLVTGEFGPRIAEDLSSRDDVIEVEQDGTVSPPPEPSRPDDEREDSPTGTAGGIGEDTAEPTALDEADEVTDWGFDLMGGHELSAKDIDGSDATIAVLDSGFDISHPDFDDAVTATRVFEGDSITDEPGVHGTPVTGVIGARDNGTGTVGIAPQADLALGKITDHPDTDVWWSTVAAAIRWAVHTIDADVINLSYWGAARPRSFTLQAAADYAARNGVVMVACAGNEGPCEDCVGYPAAYESVLAVGSANRWRSIASHSRRGTELDVLAPGESISAPIPGDDRDDSLWGTSYATPYVAGVAGLLAAEGYDRETIIDRICTETVDLGLDATEQGEGRLDAWRAVTGEEPVVPVNTTEGPDDGTFSAFDLRVRANTIRDDDGYDAWMGLDPYFKAYFPSEQMESNRETERIWLSDEHKYVDMVPVAETDVLEHGFDVRETLEIPRTTLENVSDGDLRVLTVLWDADWGWLRDDELDYWWSTIPYATGESNDSTRTTQNQPV